MIFDGGSHVSDGHVAEERQAGVRCCIPLAEGGLDDDAIAEITADLEVLAHPVRFRLLSVLAQTREPACVCDLEAIVPVKQPTVSHHLKILKTEGLVGSERRGLWTYYFPGEGALRALRRRVRTALDALDPGSGEEAPDAERGRGVSEPGHGPSPVDAGEGAQSSREEVRS
jgi:ArsR family transcriptional regulator, arsenate/arsenite/antimonite-responsive transcriptional repressor